MVFKQLKFVRLIVVASLLAAGISVAAPASAINITPFAAVYNKNINGQFAMTGNTVLTCSTTEGTNAGNCASARTLSATNNNNNAYVMRNLNTGIAGLTPSQTTFDGTHTFNSSTSTVTIPVGSIVTKAFLFWFGTLEKPSASQGGIAAVNGSDKDKVVFARNGDTCATVSACQVTGSVASELDTNGNVKFYRSYADVTNKLTSGVTWNVSGDKEKAEFSAGNIQTAQGIDRSAGWSLILVYANPNEPLRNITVYSGFSYVAQQSSEQINLSGFLTPPSGAVTSNVGVVGIEGDASSTGDSLTVTSGSKSTTVSNALNPANNFLNSTVSQDGVRNPYFDDSGADKYKNTFGVDVDRFQLIDAVPNSASSASVIFSSNLDTYFPAAMVMANELYAPELHLTKYISSDSGSTVLQGDTLTYSIVVENIGHGDATNIAITDDADPHLTFISIGMSPGCSLVSGAVHCSIASLSPTTPNGSATPVTLTFRATVSGTDGMTHAQHDFISNDATAIYSGPLGETETVSNNVNTQFTKQPTDLELAVGFADEFIQAGDSSNFTATITNLGVGNETNPTATFQIPTGLTPNLTGVSGCSLASQTVTCTKTAFGISSGTPLTPGQSASITIPMATSASGYSSFNVSGLVHTGSIDGDPNSYNDSADATLAVNHAPTALPVTISADQGGAPQSVELSLGASDPDSDSLSFVVGSLASTYGTLSVVGSTVTFTPNKTWFGATTVTYDVYDGKGGHTQSEITIQVAKAPIVQAPELRLTKYISSVTTGQAASTQVTAGDNLSYTIIVDNVGTGSATSIVLTDALDSHLTNASVTPNTCHITGSNVSCALGSLSTAAIPVQVVISGTVGAGTSPTTFSNSASATYSGSAGAHTAISNSVTTEYAHLPADLNIGLEFDKALVQANQPASLTVTISNFGAAPDANPSVVLTIPQGMTVNLPAGSACQINADQLTCPAAAFGISGSHELTAGSTASVSIPVTPSAEAGIYEISGTVTTGVADGDPNLSNNTALHAITVNRAPTATPATLTAKQGGASVKVNLTANVADVDGNKLKIKLAHLPSKYGKVKIKGKVVTFTPNSHWSGTVKLAYTVRDGHGGSAKSYITITVTKHSVKSSHRYCFVDTPLGC